MNNNLISIQEMLMNEMKRLDNLDNVIGTNRQEEVSRANALSQSAVTFLKSVNIGLRIIEISKKYDTNKNMLSEELGVTCEE